MNFKPFYLFLIINLCQNVLFCQNKVYDISLDLKEDDKFYIAGDLFTGTKVVLDKSNGQVISEIEISLGVETGKVQVYWYDSKFKRDQFKDTSKIRKMAREVEVLQEVTRKAIAENDLNKQALEKYVADQIGGDEGLKKLIEKQKIGKLKGKKLNLFAGYEKLLDASNKSKNYLELECMKKLKDKQTELEIEGRKSMYAPKIKEEFSQIRGKKEGKYNSYWENGKENEMGNFVGGNKDGEWLTNSINGSIYIRCMFKYGKLNGSKETYFPNGKKFKEEMYKEDVLDGPYIELYDNGNISVKGNYNNSNKSGSWVKYGLNGAKIEESLYNSSGQLNGNFKRYYADGKMELESVYANGKENGIVKTYFGDGKLSSSKQYQDGKLVGKVMEYFSNGQLKTEGLANSDGNTFSVVKRFNEDGTVYVSAWKNSEDPYDKTKEIFAYTNCRYVSCDRIAIWGRNGQYRWALKEGNTDYGVISKSTSNSFATWYVKINGVNQEFLTEHSNLNFLPKNIQEALLKGTEVAIKIGSYPYFTFSLNGYQESLEWLNK